MSTTATLHNRDYDPAKKQICTILYVVADHRHVNNISIERERRRVNSLCRWWASDVTGTTAWQRLVNSCRCWRLLITG